MALANTAIGSDLSGGEYINDAYLGRTAAGGTEFTAVFPFKANARTIASGLVYTTGANAHALTFMTTMWETPISTKAESGQADFRLSSTATNPADASVIANTDWFILVHEDGTLGAYKVSAITGFVVTATGNLSVDVPEGSRAFFMGAPTDHPLRRIPATPVNFTLCLYGGDTRSRVATGTVGQPMLFHSDNATAAGWAHWLPYYFE